LWASPVSALWTPDDVPTMCGWSVESRSWLRVCW